MADAEAGFGGVLNAFELMKNMIAAGAAGVRFEDQLAAAKKCGHMGGKVLVPTREAVEKLISAVSPPTSWAFRPDPGPHRRRSRQPDHLRLRRERQALPHRRAHPGRLLPRQERPGAVDQPRRRLRPYADLVWCETGVPDIGFAREFAQAVLAACPGKLLSLQLLAVLQLEEEPQRLADRFLPGRAECTGLQVPVHHPGRHPRQLVQHLPVRQGLRWRRRHEALRRDGAGPEFAAREQGYTFVSHQQEVGTGYFDDVTTVIQGGSSSVKALTGSTEEEQFH